MIEDLWSNLIQFTSQFVIPDWGALVNLIPILLAALVVLYLVWTVLRFATAGPTRRGRQRVTPVPPPGTHLPGPSFAPILGAFGTFMFVFGLVTGGPWLAIGALILVVVLLYWGREALRDYDRVATAGPSGETAMVPAGALPAPAGSPPPGVHIPAPSFRPILVALSMTLLVAGLIVGGWALVLGALAVVITGLGWLRDARREYVAVEAADRSGHLDAGPAPLWPVATFAVLAVLLIGGLVLSSGVLPNSGGGEPAASAGAGGSTGGSGGGTGGGSGAGAGGSAAPPAASLPAADVTVTAEGIKFLETSISAPADTKFTIAFDNRDSGTPHDIVIKDASGATSFQGAVVTGPKTVIYDVPALSPGSYTFVCSIHPSMTGTLTVQ
jgi:plastocyanin